MESNLNNVLIFASVFVALPLVLVLRAFHAPGDARVAAWAGGYGLELTEANRPMVVELVDRTRRFRAVGATMGWVSSGLPLLIGDHLPFGLDNPMLAVHGYLAGTLVAVLSMGNEPWPTGRRRADLGTRGVEEYLAGWVRELLWFTTGLAVVVAAVYVTLSSRPLPRSAEGSAITPGSVVALVVAAVAVAVASEVAQRRMVAQARPLTSPDVVAAHDARRAASVSAAAGAGAIVVLGALSGVLNDLSWLVNRGALRWALQLAALGMLLLAVVSFYSATRPEASWFGRRHTERSPA